jgi:hypothetical protein
MNVQKNYSVMNSSIIEQSSIRFKGVYNQWLNMRYGRSEIRLHRSVVKPIGNTGHVLVPKQWIGQNVIIMTQEEYENIWVEAGHEIYKKRNKYDG